MLGNMISLERELHKTFLDKQQNSLLMNINQGLNNEDNPDIMCSQVVLIVRTFGVYRSEEIANLVRDEVEFIKVILMNSFVIIEGNIIYRGSICTRTC